MAKKSKKGGGKRGWPRWLTFVLAGIAVAGVLGAFDRLVKYDKENAWVKGVFIAGAAVAGAFMLKKTKLIGQGAANTIGGVGIALGSYVAIGPKVYEIGNSVADSFSGMFDKTKNRARLGGDGLPTGPDVDSDAMFDAGEFMPPSPSTTRNALSPTGAAPTAPSTQPAPQQQPTGGVTNVYQAPKISGGNYLLGKGIDALANVGGSLLSNPGLFGGSGAEMGRAKRVRRFGRAA